MIIPEKIPAILKKLILAEPIQTIKVWQMQTGIESAETFILINDELKCNLSAIKKYLNFNPSHNSAVEVKREYRIAYDKRKDFEDKNKSELAEYERLKEKFK